MLLKILLSLYVSVSQYKTPSVTFTPAHAVCYGVGWGGCQIYGPYTYMSMKQPLCMFVDPLI